MSKNTNSIYQRTKSFLDKAKVVHNGKYDYSLVKYKAAHIKVNIVCPIHGKFSQIPNNHLCGNGCSKCSRISFNDKNINERFDAFLNKSTKTHNNKYDYSLVKYTNIDDKIRIICPIHGIFIQKAYDHLIGKGCAKCANNIKSTTIEFIKKAKKIHNGRYEYSLVEYINAITKVSIICHEHGVFTQIPNNHLSGMGCKKCTKKHFSDISIKWLNKIASENNIFIQHAKNVGEYHIPNTRYHADGYCEETNTVYEFHGDVFHGNLNKYSDNEKCHPYNRKITAKELYNKTINRENEIKNLGYKLVTIWESSFKNQI